MTGCEGSTQHMVKGRLYSGSGTLCFEHITAPELYKNRAKINNKTYYHKAVQE